MAPTKGKETVLETCTNAITLGSSIAIHLLDYLSVVKEPPHASFPEFKTIETPAYYIRRLEGI
jgi:hypothetical protein